MPPGSKGEGGGVHRISGFRRLWLSNVSQEVGRQLGILALSVTAVVVLQAPPGRSD